MKHKVQRISADLAERLSKWEQVDAITILESAEEEMTSPYFFISLDVFYKEDIPDIETRHSLFSDAGAFESSSYGKKDRFFIEDIPVRIEFKNLDRINSILELRPDSFWAFRDSGTYMFYRILTGKVLIQKNLWLDHIKQKLTKLPDTFWNMLAVSSQATMEHYLIDVKSAVVENDVFFYTTSLSGFLKSLSSLLFILNHEFEPSGRYLNRKLKKLKLLPEHFISRLDSLVIEEDDMTHERKADIAELLAKSVVPFINSDY
jgi:hypothetical protein